MILTYGKTYGKTLCERKARGKYVWGKPNPNPMTLKWQRGKQVGTWGRERINNQLSDLINQDDNQCFRKGMTRCRIHNPQIWERLGYRRHKGWFPNHRFSKKWFFKPSFVEKWKIYTYKIRSLSRWVSKEMEMMFMEHLITTVTSHLYATYMYF